MTSRQNRKARRAAERAARKLRNNDSALSATAGRLDEAAFLSEPKIQENDPAERAARKLRNNDSALSATACLEPSENLETEPGSVSDLAWVKTPSVNEENPISPARLAANRANAQRSTGPTSPTGKATSSKNALKTALTGRTVLLPEDDAERYERHLLEYDKIYRPLGERECELVQAVADATWRLDRIPGLEEALYIKGCNQFAAEVSELEPRARLSMLRNAHLRRL